MSRFRLLCGLLVITGCSTTTVDRNPFLTYAGAFGFLEDSSQGGGVPGETGEEIFRQDLTVGFYNNNPYAELQTSFVAWVNVSSVRTSGQQDALLRAGYVQLSQQQTLGSVFTLPVGTFVYNGPGLLGATPVHLGTTGSDDLGVAASPATLPIQQEVTLVTPDVFLVFYQPPVSCDTVAFQFLIPDIGRGTSGASTSFGGTKTFAQIDVYQCDPLSPGLFFDGSALVEDENAYNEGADVRFDFNPLPDADGAFAIVTISN